MTDDKCPHCKGSGIDPSQPPHRYTSGGKQEPDPCRVCNGTGEAPAQR